MDFTPETKLNKQLVFSYNTCTDSPQLADGSSDVGWDLNKNRDISLLPKEIPLKQLASGSPRLSDGSLSGLKATDQDSSDRHALSSVYAVTITFAVVVTVALILHVYLWKSLGFVKGVVVSDDERCTGLGHRVLHDRGSSVDAAVTAALCLGVVHPHVSGVGGGGVMLVHDVHTNQTRVINFQGTAPKMLKEEMLLNVWEVKAGLKVGVPGLLRGLHRAHGLYGSLPWEDVVTRASAVAEEGFNVSFSLANAISKVKGEQLSQRFRDMFLPGGHAPLPGSFLRMSSLAGVLEAGLSRFYDGSVSQEMEDEVRTHGGVLSRDDISNYSVQVEQPAEGLYNDFIIQVPPPPSAGAALISALKLLEALQVNGNNNTENQTHHWVAEAVKGALAIASGLGDPKYNASVADLLSDMLRCTLAQCQLGSSGDPSVTLSRIYSDQDQGRMDGRKYQKVSKYSEPKGSSPNVFKSEAEVLGQKNTSSQSSPPQHHSLRTDPMAGQVVVMGPDGLMVSFASSLGTPFGSRIVTRSGVLLNSLALDFSWSNETRGSVTVNQKTRVQPGKRPLSSLMPTMVLPVWHKCGIYMALSSSGGPQSLNVLTQVLVSTLSFHGEKNGSLSLRRLLVDPEFPEESTEFVHEKVHVVRRVNAVVRGILRINDVITEIAEPQLFHRLL